MSAEALLARLSKVRQTGPDSWSAICPAHDDTRPSLSVRALSDGRILLWDFGGCDAQTVLDAIGMTFSDLYPERLGHHFRPSKSRVPASELLLICDEEILVASIISADLLDTKTITEADWQRLAVCSRRLGKAVVELRR